MTWLLIALGAWGWLAAAAWVWRLAAAGLSYRRAPRLPSAEPPGEAPFVSILVPARNEESNIAGCLEALLAQDYPRFEVLAIDDNSTDRTGELVGEAALRDRRVISLQAPPTPEGWTGKNRALQHGAERARGHWLLFTDADVRLHLRALSSAVAAAQERGLDLLTVVPRALTGGFIERALQPCAMGFLGLWFPLDRVNRPEDPLVFGNGQFLLFRRAAYESLGGHAAVRGEYLEDFAFVREAKRRRLRVQCVLGKRLVAVRMYDSLPRLWRGWRRIYLHAFRSRPWVLLGRAAEAASLSVAPPLLLAVSLALPVAASGVPAAAQLRTIAMAGLAASTLLCLLFGGKSASAVGAPLRHAALHPLAAAFVTAALLEAARCAFTGHRPSWR